MTSIMKRPKEGRRYEMIRRDVNQEIDNLTWRLSREFKVRGDKLHGYG